MVQLMHILFSIQSSGQYGGNKWCDILSILCTSLIKKIRDTLGP